MAGVELLATPAELVQAFLDANHAHYCPRRTEGTSAACCCTAGIAERALEELRAR